MLHTQEISKIEKDLWEYLENDMHLIEDEEHIPEYHPKRYHFFDNKSVLILSGGGIKGIAFIGALKALDSYHLLDNITTFVGSSVGTLINFLYILGYAPDELYDFVKKFDLGKLKNLQPELLLDKYGLDDGTRIINTLKKFISNRQLNPKITFKELYDLTGKKLITTTVSLNNMRPCYMSHETHPQLEVCHAIRMSISIPFIFTPVIYQDTYYIDGGCIDNFPIHLFKDQMDQIIGICLMESCESQLKINNIEEYMSIVLQCIVTGITFNSVKDVEKQVIQIHLPKASIFEFNINENVKNNLYKIGYNTVMKKIKESLHV